MADVEQGEVCHLFRMPQEIQDMIFRMALEDEVINIGEHRGTKPPGLLLSCKDVYSNSVPIYYTACNFHGPSAPDFIRWLYAVPENRRCKLRRFTITGSGLPALTPGFDDDGFTAHKIQTDLFALTMCLDGGIPTGCPNSDSVDIRGLVQTSLTTTVSSASPFLDWLDVNKHNDRQAQTWPGFFAFQATKRFARFFEYEHRDNYDCWTKDWSNPQGVNCGCPRKVEEETDEEETNDEETNEEESDHEEETDG